MKRDTAVRIIIIAAIAAMALTGLSCSKDAPEKEDAVRIPPGHEEAIEKYRKGVLESQELVVANVNGAEIRMIELIDAMNKISPTYAPAGPQALTPEIDQKVKAVALNALIFRELAIQEAVRQGMKVSPEVIDQTFEALKANVGSEDAFRKRLELTGASEESMRRNIERDNLFDMITHKEIFSKAKADGKAGEAIEKRKQEWEAELKKKAKIEITLDLVVKE